jgi:hypothetical protein
MPALMVTAATIFLAAIFYLTLGVWGLVIHLGIYTMVISAAVAFMGQETSPRTRSQPAKEK